MKTLAKLVGALVALLCLLYLLAHACGWLQPDAVEAQLSAWRQAPETAAWVAPCIAGLLAADLVLPIPSSLVMMASGALLGPLTGTVSSFLGAMTGALLGFLLCRRFGQIAFHRLVGDAEYARVSAFLERYGAWAILLSRSVPMLTEVTSCVAGLGSMPLGRFLALASAGTLPLCAVYAIIGARAGDGTLPALWALLLAFLLPAVGYGWLRWRGPFRHSHQPEGPV